MIAFNFNKENTDSAALFATQWDTAYCVVMSHAYPRIKTWAEFPVLYYSVIIIAKEQKKEIKVRKHIVSF